MPEVTDTTATLRGGVNPRGSETSYLFQYGPSAAYGLQTPAQPVGAGTQEVKVGQTLAGLTANTVYHYRIVATSAAGTTFGQDRAFATRKTPLSIAIAATRNPSPFGGSFAIAGTVSGTEAASRWVVLQGDPFPYPPTGFHALGVPEQADATGKFSIPVEGLMENSQLRVVIVDPTKAISPVLTELVTVRVSFHAHRLARHGYERMYGTISPAEVGANVAFQWLRHGKPVNVGATRARKGSATTARFSRIVRIRHKGRYRAFVVVSDGKLLSHYSPTVTVH